MIESSRQKRIIREILKIIVSCQRTLGCLHTGVKLVLSLIPRKKLSVALNSK